MKRDFLELSDFTAAEHAALFRRARELKEARRRGEVVSTLAGRTLLLLFEKHSTRTRLSFEAARLFEFTLRISAPEGFRPIRGSGFELVADPPGAVRGADVVTTDVWISMGQEKEAAARRKAFAGYCVDEALLSRAKPSAIVLHCLPAHRGEEISAGVIDGPQSAVLDEAENRMHVQKALLEALILRR